MMFYRIILCVSLAAYVLGLDSGEHFSFVHIYKQHFLKIQYLKIDFIQYFGTFYPQINASGIVGHLVVPAHS